MYQEEGKQLFFSPLEPLQKPSWKVQQSAAPFSFVSPIRPGWTAASLRSSRQNRSTFCRRSPAAALPKATTSGRSPVNTASFLFPGPPTKFTQDNFGRPSRAPDYLPTFPLHPAANAQSGRDSGLVFLSQGFQKIRVSETGINPFCNNSYIYSNYALNRFSP